MIGHGVLKTHSLWLAIFILCMAMATGVQAKLELAAASANSITLTWTAPGDDGSVGQAAQYDIRYSLSNITEANWASATQVSGEPTPSTAGSTENFEVSGLSPSTTYYFAIKAADEVPNWSPLSNVVIKSTTAEETPPAAVANLTTGSATSASLTLSWTAPGDDGGTGTASLYDIRYATSAITAGNWASATQITGEPAPQAAGSNQSMVVGGLNSSTTYYFALMTADEVPNWSALSNVASGTTLSESTAPSAIANLGAGNPTETSIRLNWTAPGDDGMVGTAAQYDIRYSTAVITAANFNSATAVTTPPTPLAAGTYQNYTVSGLQSGATYYFAMKTADEVPNWSAISNVVSLATSQDATPPATTTNLIVVLPTATSLTLVWPAPGDDGTTGTASQYDVRYSTSTITTGNWSAATQLANEPTPHVAGTPESLTVTGLTQGITYYFALRTADERSNWSAMSNVASGQTSPDVTPPSSIGDLAAETGEDDGVIDLSWTAPGDDGGSGTVLGYDIRYSQSPLTEGNWTQAAQCMHPPTALPSGSSQVCQLQALVPGAVYYVGVKAYDDALNASVMSNTPSCEAGFSFILANGNIAQPASPPLMAVLPTAQPVLTVANADASPDNVYRFELATDSNFFGLVAGGQVDQQPGGTTSWKVTSSLQPENVYYWRAMTNEDGYSATWSFSVNPRTHAYPNPVRIAEVNGATFTDLPVGGELLVTSLSGSVVKQWSDLNGEDILWNGTNESGHPVASGTYLWYVPSSGSKGKLIVIN